MTPHERGLNELAGLMLLPWQVVMTILSYGVNFGFPLTNSERDEKDDCRRGVQRQGGVSGKFQGLHTDRWR